MCFAPYLELRCTGGCTQYDEWGNPQKPEFYDYMKSYSPVDNICRTAYPNILVTAGSCAALSLL